LVQQRRFRSDLYYRLNVFPIFIPPLRERPEDIPLLVEYFLRRLASRVNKEVTEVTQKDLEVLKCHAWPGNVRELQNVIERAMIRSSGPRLEIHVEELRASTGRGVAMRQTLADAERNCILDVLRQTNGVISGPNGAASRLGLPRTTLMSRMHRLGIVQRKAVSLDDRTEWSEVEPVSARTRDAREGGEPTGAQSD
jgi:formate hydrogenlyase transcriptional activator